MSLATYIWETKITEGTFNFVAFASPIDRHKDTANLLKDS